MATKKESFDYMINPENVAKILQKNFGFEICEDPIIKNQIAIKVTGHEALSLSLIQGATYLEKPMGISLKDRMEVFIHRAIFQNDKYIYSPGLFGRDIAGELTTGNTPYELFKKFPNLKNDKTVIFRPSSGPQGSNIEQQTFSELTEEEIDPAEHMIFKISDNNTYLEPFFEYLSCKAFDKLGYFSESQTPWFQQSYNGLTGGIPDYSVFYIREFDELKKKNLLPNFLLLQNLATLFAWKGSHNTVDEDYSFFIGEAKSTKTYINQAIKQLTKYSEVNLASQGYATLYDEDQTPEPYGLVNIKDDFMVNITPSQTLNVDTKLQIKDKKWIEDYAKIYLISNISFNLITDFIIKKTNKTKNDKLESFDLLTMIHNSSFSEIVDLISVNM